MAIEVFCAGCNRSYKVRDDAVGKRLKCPSGHTIAVPHATTTPLPAVGNCDLREYDRIRQTYSQAIATALSATKQADTAESLLNVALSFGRDTKAAAEMAIAIAESDSMTSSHNRQLLRLLALCSQSRTTCKLRSAFDLQQARAEQDQYFEQLWHAIRCLGPTLTETACFAIDLVLVNPDGSIVRVDPDCETTEGHIANGVRQYFSRTRPSIAFTSTADFAETSKGRSTRSALLGVQVTDFKLTSRDCEGTFEKSVDCRLKIAHRIPQIQALQERTELAFSRHWRGVHQESDNSVGFAIAQYIDLKLPTIRSSRLPRLGIALCCPLCGVIALSPPSFSTSHSLECSGCGHDAVTGLTIALAQDVVNAKQSLWAGLSASLIGVIFGLLGLWMLSGPTRWLGMTFGLLGAALAIVGVVSLPFTLARIRRNAKAKHEQSALMKNAQQRDENVAYVKIYEIGEAEALEFTLSSASKTASSMRPVFAYASDTRTFVDIQSSETLERCSQ